MPKHNTPADESTYIHKPQGPDYKPTLSPRECQKLQAVIRMVRGGRLDLVEIADRCNVTVKRVKEIQAQLQNASQDIQVKTGRPKGSKTRNNKKAD